MIQTATITKTGQITVPKWVREALGVEPGQRIVFRKNKDSVTIEREKDAYEIAEEIDRLIPAEAKAHHMKNYAGMTADEMREKWVESPEGQKYFIEELRRTL